MKHLLLSLLLITMFSQGALAQTSKDEQRIQELEKRYLQKEKLINGNFGLSLEYATLLYRSESCANIVRADSILNAVIAFQNSDEESGDYGLWPWGPGLEIGDKNVPLFHAHHMLVDLWEVQSKMSFITRSAFTLSCHRLVKAAERRFNEEIWELGRECVSYSNVFSMYVQTLVLASERFNSSRLKRMATIQWIRFYNHWKFYGIDEFLSTTYDDVIFRALLDIRQFADNERMVREADEMLDYVYLLQSAVTHPLLKLPVSGIGRDYRYCQKTGDIRVPFLKETPSGYIPDDKVRKMNEMRKYPFHAIGKAGTLPFIFQTYQLKDAAMGSMTGWGNYFWQQLHCIASAGKNEYERATLFIPGTYTPNNGFTDQKELSTFCVYNRLPTMWHITQWRGDISDIRSTMCEFGVGISNNFKQIEQDNEKIVLRAYGYDFYLFPYELKGDKMLSCNLVLKKRDTTSPFYHQRPADFSEYVFPEAPEWFGVYVKMVKVGTKVKKPEFFYKEEKEGVLHFSTDAGHSIRICIMEQGNSVQMHENDLNAIPRFTINNY